MRRKIYDRLLKWKQSSNGSSALLIEGPRKVGKSYIAEEFGRNEYRSCIVVDFNEADDKVRKIFNDLRDIPLLTQTLAAIMHKSLYERDSLFVFKDVQSFPRAREAIKFLVADGRYDYLETGSLIQHSAKSITVPSEEESVSMFPMDFEEFCWALGDEVTVPTIRACFEDKKPLGPALHSEYMKLFRKYMLVGGMPQAVMAYAGTRSFSDAEREKRSILEVYRNDILEKSGRSRRRTEMLFGSIPSQLGRRSKTLNARSIDAKSSAEDFDSAVWWLWDSRIANICFNTAVPAANLSLDTDPRDRKAYMADTGMLVTLTVDGDDEAEHGIYASILTGDINANGGMFTENIVAQMLRANGNKLFFHKFYKEGGKNRYEVDFLVRNGKKIDPIEVKSSDYTSHRSIDVLMERYSKTLGQPYIVYTKDLKKDGNVLFIPIYMAMFL